MTLETQISFSCDKGKTAINSIMEAVDPFPFHYKIYFDQLKHGVTESSTRRTEEPSIEQVTGLDDLRQD